MNRLGKPSAFEKWYIQLKIDRGYQLDWDIGTGGWWFLTLATHKFLLPVISIETAISPSGGKRKVQFSHGERELT